MGAEVKEMENAISNVPEKTYRRCRIHLLVVHICSINYTGANCRRYDFDILMPGFSGFS